MVWMGYKAGWVAQGHVAQLVALGQRDHQDLKGMTVRKAHQDLKARMGFAVSVAIKVLKGTAGQ